MHSARLIETIWQDVVYGVRMLRRSPGFTVAVVLTLALSIGANTAIFSVVNVVFLRPLPYPDPDRLVYIKENSQAIGVSPFATNREYIAWKNRNQTLAQIGAYMYADANLTGKGEAERITYATATASFFPMLGIQPVIGRNFVPEEDRPGAQPVVILSHNLWMRHFSGDPSAVGKEVILDGKSYSVVGVLPERFQIADQWNIHYALWMPFAFNEADPKFFTLVRAICRLKSGVSLESARAELDTILQSTLRRNTNEHVILTTWHEEIIRDVRISLLVFLVAVGFVLLIACVNIANLLLARAASRESEIAVRCALGAGRSRILRQLLTESAMMAMSGGVLGLAFAFWIQKLLIAFISNSLPSIGPVGIDYRVLAFTLCLSLLTGVAFGLAPAIQASRIHVNESLKEGGRGTFDTRSRQRLRGLLVVSEIALALILLIGAGLLVKSFMRLRGVDPGFRSDRILSMTVDLTPSKYSRPQDQALFFQRAEEAVKLLPGVESVALSSCLPFTGYGMSVSGLDILGHPPEPESPNSFAPISFTTVNADYFRTLNIPLLKGRLFTGSDREGTPGVAIVDESLVRRFSPNEDPIGKQLKTPFHRNELLTIVGVVGNIRHNGLEEKTDPLLYRSYLQAGFPHMSLAVRTTGDPMNLAAAVRGQIASIDRDQPPHDLMTLEQRLADSIRPRRVNMILLGTFAGLALALASVGIYGVVSYSVAQRTHEIGVRIALGAHKGDVFQMVLRRALVLSLAGVAIGLAAALGMTRMMATLLYGITATDLVTFATVPFVMIGVTLLASYLPSRRAANIDPMIALRCE